MTEGKGTSWDDMFETEAAGSGSSAVEYEREKVKRNGTVGDAVGLETICVPTEVTYGRPSDGMGELLLVCPRCVRAPGHLSDATWVHINGTEVQTLGGDAVVVVMNLNCEQCGCSTYVRFAERKGQVFVSGSVAPLPE